MHEELVRSLLARHLPEAPAALPARLGEGWDNVVYEADGLIVRLSKEPDPAPRAAIIRREASLLELVAEVATLRVPEVVFTDPDAGALAYSKVEGRALSDLRFGANLAAERPALDPATVGATLGRFLSGLHRVPVERVAGLVPRDAEPLHDWLADAERDYDAARELLPATTRTRVEDFLRRPPPAEPEVVVFCHNDLGAEHILADEAGAVTGVIDWSDAALADPVHDLALVYRDLGPDMFDRTVRAYEGGPDGPGRVRAVFYARCALLGDLAYGRRPGAERYARDGLAKLAWTFGEPSSA